MKKLLSIFFIIMLWGNPSSSFEVGQNVYLNACISSPTEYFNSPLEIHNILFEAPNKITKLEESKYEREFQTLATSTINILDKQITFNLSNFRDMTIKDNKGIVYEDRRVTGFTSIYEIKHKEQVVAWGVGWHQHCKEGYAHVDFTALRLYVPYLKNGEIIIQNKLISLKINQIYDALIDGESLILSDGVNILGSDNRNTYFYKGASFFEINNKDGINFDLSFDELKEKINIYKLSPALIISTLSRYNQISALEKYTKENFDEIYEDLSTNYWWNVYDGWYTDDIYELILEKEENYKAKITDEEIKNIKKNCLSKNNYKDIFELVKNCYFWHSSWVIESALPQIKSSQVLKCIYRTQSGDEEYYNFALFTNIYKIIETNDSIIRFEYEGHDYQGQEIFVSGFLNRDTDKLIIKGFTDSEKNMLEITQEFDCEDY